MGKITILPYEAPYCIQCGRKLPKDRREKCYQCRPPKPRTQRNTKQPSPDYTIHDRVAQATAYGLSYGHFMAALADGCLPPLKKAIVWPIGSEHEGEIR